MDDFKDVKFPAAGIDTSLEFDMQRDKTTREGENVRLFEPGTGRARGGSRPGHVRYKEGQVSGTNLIQHLAVIVDPTVEGLLADFDYEGSRRDMSTSNRRRRLPLTPERRMRRGGNGRSPSRKTPRPELIVTADDQSKAAGTTFTFDGTEFTTDGLDVLDTATSATIASTGSPKKKPSGEYPIKIKNLVGTAQDEGQEVPIKKKYRIRYVPGTMTVGNDIAFVQLKTGTGTFLSEGDPTTLEIIFDSPVVAGNLLVVATSCSASITSVSDSKGNTYTEVSTPGFRGTMYYAIANGSGANTVTIVTGIEGTVAAVILEYHGTALSAVLDSFSINDGLGLPVTSNDVVVNESNELIVGMVAVFTDPGLTFTPALDLVARGSASISTIGGTSYIFVYEKVPVSGNYAIEGDLNLVVDYTAIGAGFKPL